MITLKTNSSPIILQSICYNSSDVFSFGDFWDSVPLSLIMVNAQYYTSSPSFFTFKSTLNDFTFETENGFELELTNPININLWGEK